jgi:phytoene synthase
MQYILDSWEETLLRLATHIPVDAAPHHHQEHPLSQQAFELCEQITAQHSKSFHMATRLLPTQQRQAIRALYAFCRTVDDIADLTTDPQQALHDLTMWREYGTSGHYPVENPVLAAWTNTRIRYRIPATYVQQLLDMLMQDLSKHRYQTFEELSLYCYGVASTVGLMSMHVIGYSGEDAVYHAVKLGVALQLTNILRDVHEDWQRGRIYLPLEELHAFGLDEQSIAQGIVTPEWKAFMRFQIDRTRRLYQESMPGIQCLNPAGRLAVSAASTFYSGILTEIEKQDYDVFSKRARVSGWGKMRHIPGLWLRWAMTI